MKISSLLFYWLLLANFTGKKKVRYIDSSDSNTTTLKRCIISSFALWNCVPEKTTKYSSIGWIKHTKLTIELVIKIFNRLIVARTAADSYTNTLVFGVVMKSGVSR